MKKSIPTPLCTIFSATLTKPGCSVFSSFFSASVLCELPSSRKNSRPGPQVGSAANEHTIFPPVAASASTAEFSVGSRAGSGCLTSENMRGNCVRRDVMTALDSEGFTKRPSVNGRNGSSRSGMTSICADCRLELKL